METLFATKLFAVRDIAPVSGSYLCIPCGYVQYFEAGSPFTECLACLAGTPDGPFGYRGVEDEFWQFIG